MFGLSRTTRPVRTLAVLAAVGAPLGLALAAPASASQGSGCTVDALKPVYSYMNSSGQKVLNHQIKITCSSGRDVEIKQERWEYDATSADDFIGSSTKYADYSNSSGTRYIDVFAVLPDTDDFGDNYEEMYNRVKFQVTSTNGVVSPWYGWDVSWQLSIHV